MAVLSELPVLAFKEFCPTAVLEAPVVTAARELAPIAVLEEPVVKLDKTPAPIPVLSPVPDVVMFPEDAPTNVLLVPKLEMKLFAPNLMIPSVAEVVLSICRFPPFIVKVVILLLFRGFALAIENVLFMPLIIFYN